MAKSTAVQIPRLADVSPGYAALTSRKADLSAQRARLEAEADEHRYNMTNARPDKGRAARVGALLGDDVDDVVDPATRLREIEVEIADIGAAIAEIQTRMRAERSIASKTICAGIRKEYEDRVAGVARGLIAAHKAHADLLGIIAELNAGDVAWTGELAPMQAIRVIGEPRDNQSMMARYLHEAAALGFIETREIPQELI